ncbi:DUF222 domain-containing protein [Nocardioides sp. TF02-7]|uniref:DUF222 domain-containing protein n=1 Tax=Nocardioides sp. TF02-7 TaxID=2917724 RepID=UPI001F06087B|nr:DUF222 domain-containing protein [Nocardioides sp. TF02-7]UMG91607.1 13E12 repeat family protein [Nocardioides sp. TF02-7]
MSHSPTSTGTHPVLACAQRVSAALDEVAGVEATFMPTEAKAAAITELHRAEQRLKALRLKVMAASSDVASENAAADVASWLAYEVNADLRDARADQRLARALDDRFPVVAAAFADGRVSEEQAWVIVRAVDAPPQTGRTPGQGRRRGDPRRLRGPVHPHPAPHPRPPHPARGRTRDRRRRGRQEAGRGRSICRGTVPALDPRPRRRHLPDLRDHPHPPRRSGWTPTSTPSPARATATPPTSRTRRTPRNRWSRPPPSCPTGPRSSAATTKATGSPYPKKRAMAFCTLLERLDPHRLPEHGGDATTVLVTVTLEDLRSELGVAGLVEPDLEHGPNLTAAEVRRLACNAAIIPAVLGSDSEVLDLGRTRRLFTPDPAEADPSPRQTMPRQRMSGETAVVRDPPPARLESRRFHHPRQRGLPVRLPPPAHREPGL